MAIKKDSFTLNVAYQTPLEHESGFEKNYEKSNLSKKSRHRPNKKFGSNTGTEECEDNSENEYELVKKTKINHKTGFCQQVKSSLFAHNPEIQLMESKEVKPVCEQLFSNDLFKDCGGIHSFMVKNLDDNFGITKMTTVQKLALPALMSGADALVRSQTGSGKTLAYAIPIVESLQRVRPKLSRSDGIRAVVVLPTRELALQTYQCFSKLTKSFTWLVPGLVVGGEKRKSEKARLRKGINILIGTPGRVNDHAQNTQVVRLDQVQWLVLDEADRLLDLGYEREINSVVSLLDEQNKGGKRQTVLLSATMSPQVERLAGLTLVAPVRLDAADDGHTDKQLVIPQSLAQHYIVTPAKLRLVTLCAFIHWKCQLCNEGKMLIFMATQDMVDYHTELLNTVMSNTADFLRLHGNMSQNDRTHVFQSFKNAKSGVLICTDVAARGLDLPSVDWIVQYTAPASAADYVHRVGRTARVGHSGSALLLLVPSETSFVSQLQDRRIRLKEEEMVKCLYNLQSLLWEDDTGMVSGMESAATALQLRFETAVLEQKKLHSMACKAYISWVRFYASYPKEARDSFNFKELHLGHFAKSFALRDPPTSIGGIGKPNFKKEFHDKRAGWRREPEYRPKPPPPTRAQLSEFDSGLQPLKKKKKPNQ